MQKNIDAATPVRTGTLRRGNGLAFYDTQNGLYIEYWNRVPYSGFQHTAPYKLFFAEREMVNRVSAMFNLGFKTENGYARGEKVHAAIWKGWK